MKRDHLPIPDAPGSEMINMEALPVEVQEALKVVREYEGEYAWRPCLVSNPVRAWFRYQMRSNMEPE